VPAIFRSALCGFLLFALISAGFAATSTPPNVPVLSIRVRVTAPPEVDPRTVLVTLFGMNRPLLEVQRTVQPDADGIASFTFVDVDVGDLPETTEIPACQGYYHLVATASGTAGAVSPILFLGSDAPSFDDPANEWGRSWQSPLDIRSLATSKQPLTLALEKGVTLKGKVQDMAQRPVPGATIRFFHDLHADSHTGKGREIFDRETLTDRDGIFTLTQVFPNTLTIAEVEVSGQEWGSSWFWKSTRIDGALFPFQENRLARASLTASLDLVLQVATEPFRCVGTVRTRDGKPVAEADLNLSVAFHPDERDFIDSHTFIDGTTDAQGNFRLETIAPFVNFLTISKEGFRKFSLEIGATGSSSSLLGPGSHSFTLEKE